MGNSLSAQPGICIFPDGGWKLSSSSDNSWLSKVYLSQFVARKVLGLPRGFTLQARERATPARAQRKPLESALCPYSPRYVFQFLT